MTSERQIYKVIVNFIFATPDLRTIVIHILGIMPFFVDFVSCVGTLMSDIGLKSQMCGTFGSVDKMEKGKISPTIFMQSAF